MSDRLRIGAGLAVVVAAVVLFLVLRNGGSNDSGGEGLTVNGRSVAGVPTIRLRGGRPAGGIQELQVKSGDRVRFRVTSDIEGELHVHGYDYERAIKAEGSVDFDFPAKLQGAFEIELHHGGREDPVADLEVVPG